MTKSKNEFLTVAAIVAAVGLLYVLGGGGITGAAVIGTTSDTGVFNDVGISVPDPQEELHIGQSVGNVNMRLDTGGQAWDVGVSVGNIYPSASFGIRDVTGNKVPFVITPTGKVGIGTTVPGAPLEINAHADYAENAGQILLKDPDNGQRGLTMGFEQESGINIDAFIQTMPETAETGGAYVTDLALQPNGGYVGVGTADPVFKLHIKGKDGEPTIPAVGIENQLGNSWIVGVQNAENRFVIQNVGKFPALDIDNTGAVNVPEGKLNPPCAGAWSQISTTTGAVIGYFWKC